MNRIKYDACEVNFSLHQSTAPLGYQLDPVRYENMNRCRPDVGVVGGTNVSHVADKLVDIENDLRGQTRPLTACPNFKYVPRDDGLVVSKEYIKQVQHPVIDKNAVTHLPSCDAKFADWHRVFESALP